MWEYTCTYMYIPLHMCTYLYIPVHTCTYAHIPTHICTYLYIPTHTYTYMHIPVHTYTCLHIYAHDCTQPLVVLLAFIVHIDHCYLFYKLINTLEQSLESYSRRQEVSQIVTDNIVVISHCQLVLHYDYLYCRVGRLKSRTKTHSLTQENMVGEMRICPQ